MLHFIVVSAPVVKEVRGNLDRSFMTIPGLRLPEIVPENQCFGHVFETNGGWWAEVLDANGDMVLNCFNRSQDALTQLVSELRNKCPSCTCILMRNSDCKAFVDECLRQRTNVQVRETELTLSTSKN